jgi:serine protease Do
MRAVLLALLVLSLAAGCSEEPPGGEQGETSRQAGPAAAGSTRDGWPIDEAAAEVEPSVVQVNVEEIRRTLFGPRELRGLGSGVIYREDGYIITNAHVVEGADEVNVAFADGSTERGRVVGTDAFTDIAVVKVDRGGLPAADFAEELELRVGELVLAVGSPSGFESTVTAGVVSGLDREIPPQLTGTGYQIPSLTGLIQTDAAISPGSSGGALANRSGEIIGINVAYLPPQTGAESIGFAIPASVATSVADQLIETGEVREPFLGIVPVDLTRQEAELYGLDVPSGALVARVEPGSPADEAGLRRGDIIVALDGKEIRSSGDLYAALRDYQPGDEVSVAVVRDGERRTFDVTLGERP